MGSSLAQPGNETTHIEGYSGSVRVIPNVDRKEVTIALTLSYPTDTKTNQIVFRVQQAGSVIASAWSGNARVLAGDGLLAVLPGGRAHGFLFKFQDRQRPATFDDMTLDEFPVYGISRFGESKPISTEEIDELARTGRIALLSSGFNPAAIRSNSSGMFAPVANSTDPNTQCVAGGPGSSQCGAGGCTVNCAAGYYSCCQGGTCLCNANPPK